MFFKSSDTGAKVHEPHGGGMGTVGNQGSKKSICMILKSVKKLNCWWSQIHIIFISYSVASVIEYGPHGKWTPGMYSLLNMDLAGII